MQSISFTQCLTSVYEAWSWLLDVWSLLPFGTRQIITIKVVIGDSGRLPLDFFARILTQIDCWSLVASPSHLPHLPNFGCTSLQKQLNALSPNSRGIMEIFPKQPGLECLQKICNHCLPVQRSMSQQFQTVLSPVNWAILLPKKPSHPYFLPLGEGTKVGLPHPFGILLQGEFGLFQAD